jgi:hypothetical protein
MKKNTSEEIAHLSRQHMIEIFFWKLKNQIGKVPTISARGKGRRQLWL